jgi:hypothetical protein
VGAGKVLGKAVDVIEVAVRFVLVLLVELVAVKRLVVELGGRLAGIRGGERRGGVGANGGADTA